MKHTNKDFVSPEGAQNYFKTKMNPLVTFERKK
jgi:hypothetical protein